MSPTNFYNIPAENLGLAEFLLLHIVPNQFRRIYKFLLRSQSSIQSQLCSSDDFKVQTRVKNQEFELQNQLSCISKKTHKGNLCREDVEMVMTRLGMDPEGERPQHNLSPDDLSNLFEESAPSLDEVKAAFDVFDENRDGFIDARELQRVLCVLGLKDGFERENCRRMIEAFDENGDGRIDFNEFVKFMENVLF